MPQAANRYFSMRRSFIAFELLFARAWGRVAVRATPRHLRVSAVIDHQLRVASQSCPAIGLVSYWQPKALNIGILLANADFRNPEGWLLCEFTFQSRDAKLFSIDPDL